MDVMLFSARFLKAWTLFTVSVRFFLHRPRKYILTPLTENVAKGSGDRPTEDVIIADSGEVSLVNAVMKYETQRVTP